MDLKVKAEPIHEKSLPGPTSTLRGLRQPEMSLPASSPSPRWVLPLQVPPRDKSSCFKTQPEMSPPASSPSPSDPTRRPNPFPEFTDPFCQLPLPTLFYQLEAAHLGDLLRLWVRPDKKMNDSLGISRAIESAPDPTRSVGLYWTWNPISS